MAGPADRDTVLGWMARTGNGAKAASDHFGLPFDRVKKWAQRAGIRGLQAVRLQQRPAPAPPPPAPPMLIVNDPVVPAPAIPEDEPERDTGDEKPEDDASPGASPDVGGVYSPPAEPVAPAPARAKDNPRPAAAPKPPPKPPAPRVSAANLTAEAREKLRAAVMQQLDFLSREDTVDDQKGRADAARALQTLLLTTPDIMTFDGKTAEGGGTKNDEAAQLAEAFGVPGVEKPAA